MAATDDKRQRDKVLRLYEDLLEAAFDDDVSTVETLLKGPPALPLDPDPRIFPADTFSPLSEAAAGNAAGVVAALLARGADPNHRGKFGRTPLYRACFNEHEDVVLPLLEGGADPRKLLPQETEEVTDDEAEAAAEAAAAAAAEASGGGDEEAPPREKMRKVVAREWDAEEVPVEEGVKRILRGWSIDRTLRLLADREAGAARVEAAKAAAGEQLAGGEKELENALEEAEKRWEAALALRETRILQYDTAKCEGRPEAVLQTLVPLIDEAEKDAERLRVAKEEAREQLAAQRSKVRQHKVETTGGLSVDARVSLTQLGDLVQDAAGSIQKAGKPALLVDASENGRSFLKYRNVVMQPVTDPPDKLRDGILGAIKQGRPFLLDVLREPSLAAASAVLARVHPKLPEAVQANALAEKARYEMLLTEEVLAGSPEFAKTSFPPGNAAKFRFCFVTSCPYPEEAFLDATYSILLQA